VRKNTYILLIYIYLHPDTSPYIANRVFIYMGRARTRLWALGRCGPGSQAAARGPGPGPSQAHVRTLLPLYVCMCIWMYAYSYIFIYIWADFTSCEIQYASQSLRLTEIPYLVACILKCNVHLQAAIGLEFFKCWLHGDMAC